MASAFNEMLDINASHNRLALSTGMPEGKNLQLPGLGFVVEEVANAIQEQPPHTRSSASFVLRTDARLLGQECNGLSEVPRNRSWRTRTILRPPMRRFANFVSSSGRDLYPKRHCLGLFGKRRYEIFQRDKVTTFDLRHCFEQLVLLSLGERKPFSCTARQHGNNRSLREFRALNNDLPVNDGSGGYLHALDRTLAQSEVLPIDV